MSTKNLKSLEELKTEFLVKAKKNNRVSQSDFERAIDHLDLSDDESDELFSWMQENNLLEKDEIDDEVPIEALTDDADLEMDDASDMDDDEYLGDDGELPFDETINKVDLSSYENISGSNSNSRINDPVKMYLKEIGRVNLLDPADEPEIARRIQDGETAKAKLFEVYEEKFNTSVFDEEGHLLIQVDDLELALLDYYRTDEPNYKYIQNCIETQRDGEEAKRILISANLRLVVSIAKKYVGRGMLFLDLIQEGNMGLVKAVEKFDYTKGFKFSTYATWWIRQAITRAIADQARTIRIPVHMVETINKLTRIQRQLVQELGRDPSAEEISERMGNITPEKVREIQKIALDPVSLETPIGEEDDSHLGDFIEDKDALSPDEYANNELLKNEIRMVLEGLTEREEKVLSLRFGLEDGRTRTLEEVGKEFNVTRERIRQIEAKALRKLKHPSRSKRLRDFIDKN